MHKPEATLAHRIHYAFLLAHGIAEDIYVATQEHPRVSPTHHDAHAHIPPSPWHPSSHLSLSSALLHPFQHPKNPPTPQRPKTSLTTAREEKPSSQSKNHHKTNKKLTFQTPPPSLHTSATQTRYRARTRYAAPMPIFFPFNSSETGFSDDLCEETLFGEYTVYEVLTDPKMSGAFNPDVMGYGVRISNFVINICAGILIRWGSPKEAHDAIQNTLFQIGAIVLCTLISVVRDQLYFFDGLFTLIVVHSPIAWYILWVNASEVYSWFRGRDRISANPLLCFVILCGWVSLHLVVWFKGRKFPGENCGSLSFKTYIQSVVAWQLLPTSPAGMPGSITFSLSCASFIMYHLHYSAGGNRQSPSNRPARKPVVKRVMALVYFVFTHHQWPIYFLIFQSYYDWSFNLVVGSVEPGYSFTYGQSLSVVAAATSVYPVLKLLKQLPKWATNNPMGTSFKSELIFFWFGSGNLAAAINRKYYQNRLTLPPHEFPPRELPVTQISSSSAIPLIRIDSSASNSSSHSVAGGSPIPSASSIASSCPSNNSASTSPQTLPGHSATISDPASTALPCSPTASELTIATLPGDTIDAQEAVPIRNLDVDGHATPLVSQAGDASSSTSVIVQQGSQGNTGTRRRTTVPRHRSTY
ncbi:hypothetical protein B0H19DRAFT_1277272 [Mycena capillaripes]|nr:hypothetical protein B0H19DRAFT_1277272 [Mycena capillaripes]